MAAALEDAEGAEGGGGSNPLHGAGGDADGEGGGSTFSQEGAVAKAKIRALEYKVTRECRG